MPETVGRISHRTTPAFLVSEPVEKYETATSLGERRRPAVVERARTRTPSRVDSDEPRPRRRKKSRRASSLSLGASARASRVSLRTVPEPRRRQAGSGGFFSGLGRILEVAESATSSRPSTRGSERGTYREEGSSRRASYMDEAASSYRRPMKSSSRVSPNASIPRVNPSLLSVLSGMTGTSDRSSNSSSTITPQSYARKERLRGESTERQRRVESELRASVTEQLPNVFDFMEGEVEESVHDDESVVSSSSASSRGPPSDAGSSIAPDTPSSQSTFPSASSSTATRRESVNDLRKNASQADAVVLGRSSSNSPALSLRSLRKQPSVSDVPEDEEGSIESAAPPENGNIRHRSSSRQSRRSSASCSELQHREESLRRHIAHSHHHAHYIEPTHNQQRSFSTSSSHSDRSRHSYHHPTQQLQHYQWPTFPSSHHMSHTNGHISPPINGPPAVPDPPDLSRTTLTGYEHLALELSSTTSPVQPLYRKFSYLNHRILLYLQDELAELEEHLRLIDEILAQHHQLPVPASPTGIPLPSEKAPSLMFMPASRRAEAAYPTDLHLERRDLLGRIFQKTEQYNRALSSFASVAGNAASASEEQVSAYRAWIEGHRPVHEVETKFLLRGDDLIAPFGMKEKYGTAGKAMYGYFFAAFVAMLFLLVVPVDLVGKVALLMLFTTGGAIAVATTGGRYEGEARLGICGVLVVGALGWAARGAAR